MTLAISTVELVEKFQAGESMSFLADQYRCSRGTILYRLNQAGARTRTRAKLNSRVLLKAHKPVLEGLLGQLEKTLDLVRVEFVAQVQSKEMRKKYLARIERLEEQIHTLRELTTK